MTDREDARRREKAAEEYSFKRRNATPKAAVVILPNEAHIAGQLHGETVGEARAVAGIVRALNAAVDAAEVFPPETTYAPMATALFRECVRTVVRTIEDGNWKTTDD